MNQIKFMIDNSWYIVIFSFVSFLLWVGQNKLKNWSNIHEYFANHYAKIGYDLEYSYHKLFQLFIDFFIFISDYRIVILSFTISVLSIVSSFYVR